MSYKAAWFSCPIKAQDSSGVYSALSAGASVFFSLGDVPYTNSGTTQWGITTVAVDKDSSEAEFDDHYNQMFAGPVWSQLPTFYMMADDHEWGGDNWDHSLAQSESQTPIGATTQAEVDTHWDRGNKAFITAASTYSDNPVNADADAIAEAPSQADASAANYPVRYFRVGYDINGVVDNSTPHTEYFFIDCISYRDPIANTDDGSIAAPNKTMLGVNQRTWLKAHLSSSAATFKVIVSTKKTYSQTSADNSDTWGAYTLERDNVLKHIDDNITGVLWLVGDKHYPQVIVKRKSDGDDYDHLSVNACPIGVVTNTFAATPGIVWSYDSQVVGILEVYEDYLIPRIAKAETGDALWTGRLDAGENKISSAALAVSI